MRKTPIYLVAPEGPLRDRCASAFPGLIAVASLREMGPPTAVRPGLVLLDTESMKLGEVTAAAAWLGQEQGWAVGVVAFGTDSEVFVRTLSVGRCHGSVDVRRFADGAPEPGDLLDLHTVLREIAKVRHDLNNPLTSALAEVQILLMDAPSGVEAESLLIIQEQLRRLRDRLVATKHLRPVEAHDEIAG